MKYQKAGGALPILAIGFAAGYFIKSALCPSTPDEMMSALEAKVGENPVRYEQVIDQIRETGHLLKAEVSVAPSTPGYVPFANLRLIPDKEGICYLVNKANGDNLPITDVHGRTAAGDYQHRASTFVDETIDKGYEISVKHRIASSEVQKPTLAKKEGLTDSVSETYNSARKLTRDLIHWSGDKAGNAYEWIAGQTESIMPPEQPTEATPEATEIPATAETESVRQRIRENLQPLFESAAKELIRRMSDEVKPATVELPSKEIIKEAS